MVEGVAGWAWFVFVKSNKKNIDLRRTVNEMYATLHYANEVASKGGKVKIDSDAMAGAGKSFDLTVTMPAVPVSTIHADVMTLAS